MQQLEQSLTLGQKEALSFLLAITSLHEYVHWANNVNGTFVPYGVEFGNNFENEAYGLVIGNMNMANYTFSFIKNRIMIFKLTSLLFLIFLYSSCTSSKKKETLLTEKDTLEIIKLVITNEKLNLELPPKFKEQQLKIVRNKFLNKEYSFKINNKAVEYVADSLDINQLYRNGNPLYYMNIFEFKAIDHNNFKGIFHFSGISIGIKFTVLKNKNGIWILKIESIYQS